MARALLVDRLFPPDKVQPINACRLSHFAATDKTEETRDSAYLFISARGPRIGSDLLNNAMPKGNTGKRRDNRALFTTGLFSEAPGGCSHLNILSSTNATLVRYVCQ